MYRLIVSKLYLILASQSFETEPSAQMRDLYLPNAASLMLEKLAIKRVEPRLPQWHLGFLCWGVSTASGDIQVPLGSYFSVNLN